MSTESETDSPRFVAPPDDAPEFVVDSPKGAIKIDTQTTAGRQSYTGPRTAEPPKDKIEDRRLLYNTDPHVGHSIEVTLDWLLADGYNVSERHIPGSDEQMDLDDVTLFRRMLINSDFERKFHDWIENAATEGHGFMELVVEDGIFRPRLLPFERMYKYTDEYGRVEKYILEPPDGGGPDADEATVYEPYEVAEFYFRKAPLEDFGHPLSERVEEQADMLRDMEIDFARFIATKAYPPIFFKFGTENNDWTEDQMDNWLDEVESIEPDSIIGGPHDIEVDIIGTTSTSSSAGAMRLEETYKHFENRIITGIGVPAVLANMSEGQGPAEAIMPAFKRRIRRYQSLIRTAVEEQIIRPIYARSIKGVEDPREYDGLIPEFEFGEYSSAEKRLEIDKLIKLFNNGLLTRESLAKRAGIDPEMELPPLDQLESELIPILLALSGNGDAIQNPDGGSPTATGGGAQSSGREVIRREDASSDQSSPQDRPRKSPTEDES